MIDLTLHTKYCVYHDRPNSVNKVSVSTFSSI